MKKHLKFLLCIFVTQLPRIIGYGYWLPESNTPVYFYLAKYVLEVIAYALCIFIFCNIYLSDG